MIVASNTFDRFIASLRIFGTLVAGAVLIAGMNTALTPARSAAACGGTATEAPAATAAAARH
jgi:hypothetical protein